MDSISRFWLSSNEEDSKSGTEKSSVSKLFSISLGESRFSDSKFGISKSGVKSKLSEESKFSEESKESDESKLS